MLLISFAACEPTKTDNPLVTLETEMGNIVIEVMVDKAPLSGGDFSVLRRDRAFMKAKAFTGSCAAHDNDNGSPMIDVIQGGVIAEGMGLEPVAHETTDSTGIKHSDGTISLARGDVGTGSAAYFFITVGEQPSLDFGGTRNRDGQGFAAFGRVVEGMDVVSKIHNLDPELFESSEGYMAGQILKEPVRIIGARVN